MKKPPRGLYLSVLGFLLILQLLFLSTDHPPFLSFLETLQNLWIPWGNKSLETFYFLGALVNFNGSFLYHLFRSFGLDSGFSLKAASAAWILQFSAALALSYQFPFGLWSLSFSQGFFIFSMGAGILFGGLKLSRSLPLVATLILSFVFISQGSGVLYTLFFPRPAYAYFWESALDSILLILGLALVAISQKRPR